MVLSSLFRNHKTLQTIDKGDENQNETKIFETNIIVHAITQEIQKKMTVLIYCSREIHFCS